MTPCTSCTGWPSSAAPSPRPPSRAGRPRWWPSCAGGAAASGGGAPARAGLPPPAPPPLPPPGGPVRRGRGGRQWRVVTGMAVLAPLGADALPLLAQELGLPVEEVAATLDILATEQVLDTGGWAFRVPAIASALAAHVGPA